MRQSEALCPLCSGKGRGFYENGNQVYLACDGCQGVFLDAACLPDRKAERERYEQHNNDVYDEGYRRFVSPIVDSILNDFSPGHEGLDFGAGTGPVISAMLEERGYRVKRYDPFFHDYPELLLRTYDYIACCEVIEHFYNPRVEFKLLKKLLAKGGRLYCKTDLLRDGIDFPSWYYKNDPTHVFFYQPATLRWIRKEFGFKDLAIRERLIIFSL